MADGTLLLLTGAEVDRLLAGREAAMLDAVGAAYRAHARGQTAMPPDGYLRFPGRDADRIISKAAYLGGDLDVAGVKWIASVPGNVRRGMERASATLILNATDTGRPVAVMEGSIISARRTAASAALGARALCPAPPAAVGLIGCGLINFETLRFLLALFPGVETVRLVDASPDRAAQFAARARALAPGLRVETAATPDAALACPLVSLATTALRPHIDALDASPPGAVLLHLSLRDLAPPLILAADNLVDDRDKVCSNQTSLHLAEQAAGGRAFIRATIGEVLTGDAPPAGPAPYAVFSPFGLGILDLALAHLVYREARAQGAGTVVDDFLPPSWLER